MGSGTQTQVLMSVKRTSHLPSIHRNFCLPLATPVSGIRFAVPQACRLCPLPRQPGQWAGQSPSACHPSTHKWEGGCEVRPAWLCEPHSSTQSHLSHRFYCSKAPVKLFPLCPFVLDWPWSVVLLILLWNLSPRRRIDVCHRLLSTFILIPL